MKKLLTALLLLAVLPLCAQKRYTLQSPNKRIVVTIEAGKRLTYAVHCDGKELLQPSPLALQLTDGRTFGVGSHVKQALPRSIQGVIDAPFHVRARINDRCNELTLRFSEPFSVIFRAYNEGIAYRFVSSCKSDFEVASETAGFCFGGDYNTFVPYVRPQGSFDKQYYNSFENTYTYAPLSKMNNKQLAFIPVAIEVGDYKVAIAEADLENYPGMFVLNPDHGKTLEGRFATYPKAIEQGGHNLLQGEVTEREKFIAKCKPVTRFPWRVVMISKDDCGLADNDLIYKLASPSRVADFSWVKPGKVAWDWWNDWGLKNVNFQAGVNNDTYKAYIDFAAKHQIEYVILDEGWAVNLAADLMQVVPEIDLKELTDYAKKKQVGLILWAGYKAFSRDMEQVCEHYSRMGIKGFKIDFMDRDDQQMVEFHYRAAEIAARYHLMVDFHGTYKPTGLNRTYPNVVSFEGVHGLEQLKWGEPSIDQVAYDVTIPYLRNAVGPMDYTPGAMRNASKDNYRPVNSEPMSQGTRCHQLAAYVVFFSPFSMLCDSPSAYAAEPECTDFIAGVPTVWDETHMVDGKIGQYVVTARRKGNTWYVGAMTNWDPRTVTVDLSFLGDGEFNVEAFSDGLNANKIASDYVHSEFNLPSNRKVELKLASGGGSAMKITRK